ncbi:hypothetical protein FHW75_002557 [Pseudomonas sp. OG7]|uniref:hypothetical protein n=1 Tax=Pseudomonas sp. OG7 TaxID=2587037 RepID=UPI00161B9FE4|nr:hypothetical protein [Pseudomonas sp. OG7]MBB3271402.1 hypothetical protein [Pseudomonas sp. OG7]
MICTRTLKIEHEEPRNDRDEGAFTIMSTNSFPDRDYVKVDADGRHRFAILWNGKYNDNRIIDVIGDMSLYDSMGPLRLLHPSGRTLILVYAATLTDQEFNIFSEKVTGLASQPYVGAWKINYVSETEANSGLMNEHQFNNYAPYVLQRLMQGAKP